MDNSLLKKVQEYQLNILKEVVKICNKYNLRYYLIGGTLLGAVRHKGFIPWDDDLDIAMPRKDYEIFLIKFMEESPKDLFLQNTLTDNYWMFITKIRLNNSVFDDDISVKSKCHKGIYIDIFPLDKVPQKDSIVLSIRYLKIRFLSSIAAFKNGKRKYKHLFVKILSFLFSFYKYSYIYKTSKKLMMSYYDTNSNYVTSFMSNYGYKKQRMNFDEVYGDGTFLQFENSFFKVPINWNQNLKQIFNNYMELPPIEKRGNRHIRLKVQLPSGECDESS